MSASHNFLELAKQGNEKAIAALLNRALQPKGISVKAIRQEGCLRVLLESAQLPDQQALVSYLQKNFVKLAVSSIHTIEVQAKQAEVAKIAWSQQIRLQEPQKRVELSADLAGDRATSASIDTSQVAKPKPTPATLKPKQPQKFYQAGFSAVIAVTLVFVGASFQSILKPGRTNRSNITLSAEKGGVYQAQIVDRLSGIPVILVKFNGSQAFPMMVDTGASGTLITPGMATNLGLEIVRQIKVQTPSGYSILDVGYVNSIEVEGVKVEKLPVAIGLPHMNVGLLGHDFFGDLDVTVRQDVVEFRPRQ
jgi:aspartyl protease family protein